MAAEPTYIVTTGDYIGEWMEDHQVTGAELARRLGVTRKHGFITAEARDKADTVRELLSLLGVGSLAAFSPAWQESAVSYRRSAAGRRDAKSIAVWLRLAERQVDRDELPRYDAAMLEQALPSLRAPTLEDPAVAIQEAKATLRRCGTALALVPAVPGLRIHGATHWYQRRPLIQLSLLFKSDDQLWFTLFHELGHVLLHDPEGLYLEGDPRERDADEAEEQADHFASRLLVPEQYRTRPPRRRNRQDIEQLAEDLGVAPSIVLGQAQRLTRDYGWGHALRRAVETGALASHQPPERAGGPGRGHRGPTPPRPGPVHAGRRVDGSNRFVV